MYCIIQFCKNPLGCVSLKYRTESGTAKPGRDYRHCEGQLLFEDGDVEYEEFKCKCFLKHMCLISFLKHLGKECLCPFS